MMLRRERRFEVSLRKISDSVRPFPNVEKELLEIADAQSSTLCVPAVALLCRLAPPKSAVHSSFFVAFFSA